jgi:hypothetical protein
MIARLIGIVAAFAMTMSAASAATFTSPEGNFTAEFPAAPNAAEIHRQDHGGHSL